VPYGLVLLKVPLNLNQSISQSVIDWFNQTVSGVR